MAITALGTGSGLDLENLVNDLVNAEIAPQSQQLDRQEIRLQTELSAVGSLKSALDGLNNALQDFTDASEFLQRTAKSGNPDTYTVRAETNAVASSYQLEVQRLATEQKLRSAAYADTTSAVGTGTLTFQVGPTPAEPDQEAITFDIVLEDGSNSLADLRDAINSAEDNPGVTASIVNGDDGAYLVLSSGGVGKDNELTITASADATGLEGLTFDPADVPGSGLQQQQEALDSIIVLDGVTVTSSSNVISSAVDGVTITLLEEDPGNTSTLSVSVDKVAIEGKIDRFISAFNSVGDLINSLTSFNPETEVGGPLLGDSTARTVEAQLRAVVGGVVRGLEGSFNSLPSIGVSFDADTGKLVKNQTVSGFEGVDTVSEALDQDLAGVAELFTSENGIAQQLLGIVGSYVEGDEDSGDSVLGERIKGLEASIAEIDEEREELEDRAIELEAQLREEFIALDLLLAELNSTSQFLTQQLANLGTPSFGGA